MIVRLTAVQSVDFNSPRNSLAPHDGEPRYA